MDGNPSIMAAASLSFGTVTIVDWHWPSPMDVTARETHHMIEMSLPPFSAVGTASLPEIAPQRFTAIGAVFLRPAGVAVRSTGAGGHVRTVRVAVIPERLEEMMGTGIASEEEVLRVALDLRSDGPKFLLQRMRAELERPGIAAGQLLEAYGTALMIETVRSLHKEVQHLRSRARLAGWQYRRVCDRILDGEATPTVTELAGLCGLSVRHFLRLYRALTGECVTQQIARVQLDRASALLQDGDLSMKEVATRLGFAHAGSFSTAFRRATGVSPSAYRQRLRGDRSLTI